MKNVFLLNGGLQKVNRCVQHKIQAIEIAKTVSSSESNSCFAHTAIWAENVQTIADELNDRFDGDAIFSISGFGEKFILDISPA